jgi:hypothetical protein
MNKTALINGIAWWALAFCVQGGVEGLFSALVYGCFMVMALMNTTMVLLGIFSMKKKDGTAER